MTTVKSNGDAIGIEPRNGTQEISVTSVRRPWLILEYSGSCLTLIEAGFDVGIGID